MYSFVWTEDEDVTFEVLKQAIATLPLLALNSFSLPLVIETNASRT